MANRAALVLLLLTLATATVTAFTFEGASIETMSRLNMDAHHRISATCNGLVGDCMDQEEEMMMGSDSARRSLAAQRRYISYGALNKNNVPCSKRGNSYYGCNKQQQANPYRRGCAQITNCARSQW